MNIWTATLVPAGLALLTAVFLIRGGIRDDRRWQQRHAQHCDHTGWGTRTEEHV